MKTRESGMPEKSMWEAFYVPARTLAMLGLNDSHRDVVDVGCGYGTFSVPAARIVQGTVYAFDVDPRMVEATKAAAEGRDRVVAEHRDVVAEGFGLPDGAVDFVMLFNILHAEERDDLLREAKRVLSPGGTLAVMHWNYDSTTPRGPSMSIRPTPDQCRAWTEAHGFALAAPGKVDLPPYHYGFRFHRGS